MKFNFKRFKNKKIKRTNEPMSTKPVYLYEPKRLMFPKGYFTSALGRNGVMNVVGLYLEPRKRTHSSKSISIAPVNTKGNVGRCYIEVHKTMVPELIHELQRYLDSQS
jgi:hypothetical protein